MRRSTKSLLIAVLALLVLVVVASGCGDDNKSSDSGGTVSTKTEGQLQVGSDIPYKPFEFGDPPYQGFDVDLVNAIAKKMGLEARFIKTPYDTIYRNLAQGKFDMVASAATITPDREKEVDFSDPYFPADQSLMVKRGSAIKTVDDLKGKVVGAQLGTTGAAYAKDKTDAKTVRTYDLIDDAFNALGAGQVEAVINDCPVSKFAEKAHKDLVVVRSIPTNERYGFAFPSDSDELRVEFNKQLAKVKEEGTVGKLQKQWLGTTPCEGLPGTGS
jgi:ABC-type amino acid transport substrate-binding protein